MLRKVNFFALIMIGAILVMSSCKKEDPDAIAASDRKKILEYIAAEGLEEVAVEHESGLFYVVENPGTGVHPTLISNIRIRYTGYYIDEKVFDSSVGSLFQLQRTILGWQIGIPLFKNGGKGKLMIPSAMGYGAYPPYGSGIRRNAVLIFDFEIIDIGS